MLDRIVRAIRLDWTVFRDIAQDPNALKEAAIIAVIASFLSALGQGAVSDNFFAGFFINWATEIVVLWLGWAVLTYFVGATLFKGESTIPEMLRVLGYATAPRLLGLFVFVPCVGWAMPFAGWILAAVAGVLAVREAMDLDTSNAIVTVLISGLISVAIQAVFWFVF